MKLLDFLFKSRLKRVDDPAQLRDLLFEAAAGGASARSLALCKQTAIKLPGNLIASATAMVMAASRER